MEKIKIAIVGIGNCASSLLQGIAYYANMTKQESSGIMHWDIGGYKPSDIKVAAAFDIDERKVDKDVSKAIFEPPNCTKIFHKNVPLANVMVTMGKIADGVADHMKTYSADKSFIPSKKKEAEKSDIVKILKDSKAEILINYLPVGSEEATRFYVECCLEAGVALINAIPVFIASNPKWAKRFKQKNLPIVGDDIKSQLGATITHRTLAALFENRRIKLERTYQLNVGGNTDFLNMLERKRLDSKKISKVGAVQAILDEPLTAENIQIGPSDYIAWQKDNKICFIRMEGRLFGDVPMNLELRLSVEDSPNSAGVIIDAVRCCKLALDRGQGGPLYSTSAYLMKTPPKQFTEDIARRRIDDFIGGKRVD